MKTTIGKYEIEGTPAEFAELIALQNKKQDTSTLSLREHVELNNKVVAQRVKKESRKNKPWNNEEIAALTEFYVKNFKNKKMSSKKLKKLSKQLTGRTSAAISNKAMTIGLIDKLRNERQATA